MSAYRKIIKQELEDYRSQLSGCLLKMKNGNGIPWPHDVTAVSRFISRRLYHPDLDIAYMKENKVIKSRKVPSLFSYHIGVSITTYINRHRVQASQRILCNPKLTAVTVTDLAYKVGYRRSSTYIKAFKRCEDIPPGRWKDINLT
ncbi:helix-turn-helix domain-containing protein [Fodinibius salinus]|uniref:helix-turn-helix domain-containing protein n=1 Tax=Fodinibius salinus TaxID=860790 RepID=UPI0011E75275|nr:AraC family transcriptional regulator [Fodinibius salinus]